MSGSRDAARAGIGFGTALAIFCLAALGCDGDTPVAPTPQPSEPTLQSLEISGTTAFEGLDVMEQLAAIAQYSDGSSENVSERSTWQTSDPTVVKVSGM